MITRKKKDLDVSLNLITLQQEAEEAEVNLEALVESMNITKHSLLLLKEVKHKKTKDYVSEQSCPMSDISSIRSLIITENPKNVCRTRYQEDFPNHDIQDTADKHTLQYYEMPVTSKTEIHSIRDYEAPTESEIPTGDLKNKEKTVTHTWLTTIKIHVHVYFV